MNYRTERYTARALAVLLWIAGSAYLVRNEMAMPTPDWVVIATMPLIWLAVIALPILAHHAWKQREFTACLLLSIAAIVGSCFTLQGTIARQSEARDGKVAEAQASNFKRAELLEELGRAKLREADATKYGDAEMKGEKCGPRCQDWRLRAKEVKAHIDQLTASITALGADKPVASGERRIAAAIALLPFVTASQEKIEAAVALFQPSLFGMFLELAALALAFFGWRPVGIASQTVLPAPQKAADGDPELAGVSDTELDRLRRYFAQGPVADEGDPKPDPTKPRKSKRGERRQSAIMKLRERTLAGERPSLKLVMARHKVSKATASRWRSEAKRSLN